MIHSLLLYFIYFIICLCILLISYIAIFYYKKNLNIYHSTNRNKYNLNLCKEKYNINSTLLSHKNNSLSSAKFNIIHHNDNNDTNNNNTKYIINHYFKNYNNDLSKNIINSYLICKQNIDKLSLHNYSTLKEFIELYKNNIVKNNNHSYNIILKFYNNDNNFKLVHMKNFQLIKITNNDKYLDILNSIQYKKIFASSSGNDNLISFGECITLDCSNNDIVSIFNNNNHNNKNEFDNFNHVNIYIWNSAKIN